MQFRIKTSFLVPGQYPCVVEEPSGQLLVVNGYESAVSVHELSKHCAVKLLPSETNAQDAAPSQIHRIRAATVDASGNIYVSDGSCVSCLKVDGSMEVVAGSREATGDVDGAGGDARFGSATIGMASAPDGSMMVADFHLQKLKRVFKVQDGWRVETVPDPHKLINGPAGVVYSTALDSFIVACYSSHMLVLVSRQNDGSFTIKPFAGVHKLEGSKDGHASEALFSGPCHIACDARGGVVVCDAKSSAMRYISHTGQVQTVPVVKSDGVIARPHAGYECWPCITSSGQLFIAGADKNKVWLMDHGGALTGDRPDLATKCLKASAVMMNLWQQQQNGEHCDVTFQVGGEEIRAHRGLLAATSKYFSTMLSSRWDHQQAGTITIGGTTAPVFKTVLSWLYTQQLKVDQGADMMDVILLAKQYLLPDLEGACSKALALTVKDPSSAARVFVWADQHAMDELRVKAKTVLLETRQQAKGMSDADKEILLQHPALMFDLWTSVP